MIVPRFRSRNQSMRPVNRIKHVVDTQLGLVLDTQSNQNLIKSVDAPILANPEEVVTGSVVNAVYLKVEAYATTASALANLYMLVLKNPGAEIVVPQPNQVGISDAKRFVIHQEMVMLEQSVNGNPRTVFNGVIIIPRGYRRFGPNDFLQLALYAPGVNTSICFQCHYKEFR